MTTPAVYAEGLRTLWFLASRGVSATWDGATVVLAPSDPMADVQALDVILRPDADGRAYLVRARERHALFLQEIKAAKPADVDAHRWRRAIEGLESFLLSGWADEALSLGWPADELFRVPELWSQIHLCGVALLIGDHEVTEVTASRIGIKTASGSPQGFYRKPQVDYRLVYETRRKLLRRDVNDDEAHCRSYEYAVSVFRDNTGVDLENAKTAVIAAIAAKGRQS